MNFQGDINNYYDALVKKNGQSVLPIDFFGINLYEFDNTFSTKIYYLPIDCVASHYDSSDPIVRFSNAKSMTRFVWNSEDLTSQRKYIALYNRTNENMICLFNYLLFSYPFLSNYIDEIKTLSEMSINDNINLIYSSLYIIGNKISSNTNESIIGFEWITRKCIDTDDIGYSYTFDDDYFTKYLINSKIKPFERIMQRVEPLLKSSMAFSDIHLWFFAADYSAHNCKYKIYYKCSGNESIKDFKLFLQRLLPNIKSTLIDQLLMFCSNHSELYLHGFAVALDDNNWSTNLYFKPTEMR